MLDKLFRAKFHLETVYSGIPNGPRKDRIILFLDELMKQGIPGERAALMLGYTYVAGMNRVTDELLEKYSGNS